jgi:uncharacterized membrane protein YciS (DUF1049 family)
MKFFLFLALIVAVGIIFFTLENTEVITLSFFQWELSGPVPLILSVPFGVGIVAGMALFVPLWWKKTKSAKTFKRRVHELEGELTKAAEKIVEEPKDSVVESEKADN